MHKYFARRPWNVFSELIIHYSSPGDIVLDPFCGGGVTVVESLRLRRRAVGVDVNPLATYVTKMEVRPLDPPLFQEALSGVRERVGPEIEPLYETTCTKCNSRAIADWIEWDERDRRMIRLKYNCSQCGSSREKVPTKNDIQLSNKIEVDFAQLVKRRNLWFPRTRIPPGDKTDSLLAQNIHYFYELFTPRNLLALSILSSEIDRLEDSEAKDFLQLAFSSSLKWASRQSHLRGEIVEGWAMHAYWIYPKSLEINVWNTFERRTTSVVRGKRYSNHNIGSYCNLVKDFDDLVNGPGTCLLVNASSDKLPIPDATVDVVITDPPYGGNVNYAELADYWHIWQSKGKTIEKKDEVIVNKTQGKTIGDYERMLHMVFKECYRVLKPNRCLVSTFNSRDLHVVASFVTTASRAGFTLHPDGLLYQNPIRAYTTTFHAMQIGAFVGDFIFTFVKEKVGWPKTEPHGLTQFQEDLDKIVNEAIRSRITEPQLRERAYRTLIPFLADHARGDLIACGEAVDFFEARMRKHDSHFTGLRRTIAETRRQVFLRKK
jgi:16S rRNA G966 N2-methylase RsmD